MVENETEGEPIVVGNQYRIVNDLETLQEAWKTSGLMEADEKYLKRLMRKLVVVEDLVPVYSAAEVSMVFAVKKNVTHTVPCSCLIPNKSKKTMQNQQNFRRQGLNNNVSTGLNKTLANHPHFGGGQNAVVNGVVQMGPLNLQGQAQQNMAANQQGGQRFNLNNNKSNQGGRTMFGVNGVQQQTQMNKRNQIKIKVSNNVAQIGNAIANNIANFANQAINASMNNFNNKNNNNNQTGDAWGGNHSKHIGLITAFEQVVRGRLYEVTNDLEFLQEKWDECRLDRFTEVSVFKGVKGRVTDLDPTDNTVKLTWKQTDEWFPIFVLTETTNEWNNKKSNNNRGNANNMGQYDIGFGNNAGNDYANDAGLYDNDNAVYETDGEGVNKITDIVVGRKYMIVSDIDVLKDYWRAANLPMLDDADMKELLNRTVKVLRTDTDDTVQVRFTDTHGDQWFPFQVLQIVRQKRDPNAQRGNNTQKQNQAFHVGDTVILQNVVKEEYNGKEAKLLEQFYDKGVPKWRVRVPEFNKIVRVQIANMKPKEVEVQPIVLDQDGVAHEGLEGEENVSHQFSKNLHDMDEVMIGGTYRITMDDSYLNRALAKQNIVLTQDVSDIAGEVITAQGVDKTNSNVMCLFSSKDTAYLPFWVLEKIDNAATTADGYRVLE